MSKLLYQNLRYGNQMPVFGTGTICYGNEAAYKTDESYGEPATPYREITWVYSTDSSYSKTFDTGIQIDKDLKIRLVFSPRGENGDYIVGYMTYDEYESFRIFNYASDLYFDLGNNRIGDYSSGDLTYEPMHMTMGSSYDITFGNFYYKDNNTNVVYGSESVQVDPSTVSFPTQTIYFMPYYFKFHSIQIWDSSNELVYDLVSVLDENNVAAFYDKVSGTYIYDNTFVGQDITPVTLSVSSNDSSMGTVSGGGSYYYGDSVTVYATPTSNAYYFVGWYSGGNLVSNDASYSFTIDSNTTLQGVFAAKSVYTLSLSSNDLTMGTVSGGGSYYDGDSVSAVASAESGNHFVGWYSNGTLVSNIAVYTFTITSNTTLQAVFEVNSSQYTEVSYLVNNNDVSIEQCYFNTGVSIPSNGVLEARMQFFPLHYTGLMIFGNIGTTIDDYNYEDNNDCRLFWYFSDMYCDVGDGRYSTSRALNTFYDWTWNIDTTNCNYSIANTNGSTILNNTFSSWEKPNQVPFYIVLDGSMKFKALTLTLDNVVVFNGIAVLDNNSVPCIYDSVSGSFFYAQGDYASYLTYEQ